MRDEFHPGQRWISDSEPELGLGSILRVSERRVAAQFRATGEVREYARANAPLRRVRFRIGDTIKNRKEKPLVVEHVTEHNGLIYYRVRGRDLCETELSDALSFNEPQERLLVQQFDPSPLFDLRVAALQHQHRQRKSGVRGFAGARIDLIPHQLYIASEVAGRLAPRVLLADEVGLGKTIEACLILHRLILTGRAQRVLILVPESLVHQWFVELLRRFNLWFHIFDEERCKAIEEVNLDANPFLDDQLVLSSMTLFTKNEIRAEQAAAAGWDILVVDEAHHLGWSPRGASLEYVFVETLSRKTPGLLLLTATPDQLGIESHFARLRLLDPDRFYDLEEFIGETAQYREVAIIAEQIHDADKLNQLLDQHGTGRVSFRNTRATIKGFPRRVPQLHRIEPGGSREARFDWLAAFLRQAGGAKVLLICRTQARVASIETALRERIKNVRVAVFHEGLSLIQRDRNAAWFAEPNGAQILVCSEIGSEGRNFQFAHHLVLFDLPFDPELVEQRIGRLDRIGQVSEIQVHVPFVAGSAMEVLARWYQEGLNAFEKNLEGGSELFERFGARVYDLSVRYPKGGQATRAELEQLIRDTASAHAEISERLQKGRDRLLELNSFRPKVASLLVEEIRTQDEDRSLDQFMLSVFDQFALEVQEIGYRTYKLGSAGVLTEAFPGLPTEGLAVTGDRALALAREDVQFLTWDHPLVTGAMDLLLGSEKGNCSMVEGPRSSLEAVYVLECIAPPHLHVDRFLPPTPVRVFADHLEKAQEMADKQAALIVKDARKEMNSQLEHEIARLKELKKVNRSVRADEIGLLAAQQHALDHHLIGSRLRLDALRVTLEEE